MMNMSLQWRDEWETAKIVYVMDHIEGIVYRLQLSAAFMKWKRKNTNINRIRSGFQLIFSIALRKFLHQKHRAFSTWRTTLYSAAHRHSEALLQYEKVKRGAVMVYAHLACFRLSVMRRLWTNWKRTNAQTFKLEAGTALTTAGVRLVTSILTRSVVARATRVFKLWSDQVRYHTMYYQSIERGGRLLFAILTRKLCLTHKQQRFVTWREGSKRLVDGEQRQKMLARSILQTWNHTIHRIQSYYLSSAWSHWRGLCAAATRNQVGCCCAF